MVVEQISSSDAVIRRQYTYDGIYGVHTVTVRAFNLANNDTVSADVDVLEWPCQPPNVTLDAVDPNLPFLDPNLPLTVQVADGFTVCATVYVNCMKNERFTARWELEDSDQNVVRTLVNASQLVSPPYVLPGGIYTVKITASVIVVVVVAVVA